MSEESIPTTDYDLQRAHVTIKIWIDLTTPELEQLCRLARERGTTLHDAAQTMLLTALVMVDASAPAQLESFIPTDPLINP